MQVCVCEMRLVPGLTGSRYGTWGLCGEALTDNLGQAYRLWEEEKGSVTNTLTKHHQHNYFLIKT